MQAVTWSLLGLGATATLQLIIVMLSGSMALLADTIHNFGDAATAVPLWIAFKLARRHPTKRFTYGYGRVEDLAGVIIVLIILFSAILAGYLSIDRLLHPRPTSHLGAVMLASLAGFLGNEGVALFRIGIGKEIGSAALIADGQHARIDGWTSLAVLFGALGVRLGYPMADPLIGLLIAVIIGRIVWESGHTVFLHLLDGVDPRVIDEINEAAARVQGVHEVTDVRIRWLGHRMHAEVSVAISTHCSVEQGHDMANEVRHQLLHQLPYLSNATIHVDPVNASGERHHRIAGHKHGAHRAHSH